MVHDSAGLEPMITTAVTRLHDRLQRLLPLSRDTLRARLDALAPSGHAGAYFLHPKAFPTLQLARWYERTLIGTVTPALQQALVSSSIAGYYAIRLVDNAMDETQPADLALLPMVTVLHDEFRRPYSELFAADSPFWPVFDRVWAATADAAVCDAQLTDLDAATFRTVSARKVGAVAIPLTATALFHGVPALPVDWQHLVAELGSWHQMRNDVGDWFRDHQRGQLTYFLAEGQRRKAADEPLVSWVIREGLAWGWAQQYQQLDALVVRNQTVGSEDLETYLAEQRQRLGAAAAASAAGLSALGRMLSLAGKPR